MVVTTMILNIAQATIFAHCWRLQVKAYELDRMPQSRITCSFTGHDSAFHLNWRYFINQLHWRLLPCILSQTMNEYSAHVRSKSRTRQITSVYTAWHPKNMLLTNLVSCLVVYLKNDKQQEDFYHNTTLIQIKNSFIVKINSCFVVSSSFTSFTKQRTLQ